MDSNQSTLLRRANIFFYLITYVNMKVLIMLPKCPKTNFHWTISTKKNQRKNIYNTQKNTVNIHYFLLRFLFNKGLPNFQSITECIGARWNSRINLGKQLSTQIVPYHEMVRRVDTCRRDFSGLSWKHQLIQSPFEKNMWSPYGGIYVHIGYCKRIILY